MLLRCALAGVILSIGLALAGVFPAWAHNEWSNGIVVPPWAKTACCGVADVHRLTREQVHIQPDGSWRVDGYNKIVPAHTELPSPDPDYYWIFYRTFPDGDQSSVYCFFTPMDGS